MSRPAEDSLDLQADVRSWLTALTDVREPLGDTLRINSQPGSVAQNHVLDLVRDIVGTHEAVAVDRWNPDWDAVAALRSPTDDQNLFIPLVEHGGSYADVLPELQASVFTLDRGTGPSIQLNGHVDVVPVDDQDWSGDPFDPRVEDGRMVARGAMDMKAGLVAAALAFRYLAERWRGSGTVTLAVVPEEETGGNGTLAVLERGHVPDAVVFTEPTDLRIVHRHVGIQGFQVDVAGRPGGMLRRSWGTSAAPTLARAALGLEELERVRTAQGRRAGGYDADDLPGYVNFTMQAGDWIATRAAHGRIEGLMGVLPGETQAEAAAQLREAVRAATAGDDVPTVVTVWPGGHRGAELAPDHALVTSFASAATGPGSPTAAGTMVCDAKIVMGGGWAPAIVLGPVGGNLHSADEWVDLDSVGALVAALVTGVDRHQSAGRPA